VQQLRAEKKFPVVKVSLHMGFAWNPGTGKTTVARLLGRAFKTLGVLSHGHLVETDRAGLVAGYAGQTAIKVSKVLASAQGGVLLVDEAYSLTPNGNNAYGQEAIATLLKCMEDARNDLVVIAAGYPVEMERFLDPNPGIRSRFSRRVIFDDYTPDELTTIFESLSQAGGYRVSDPALAHVLEVMRAAHAGRDRSFGNASSRETYSSQRLADRRVVSSTYES
jgi:SpoVK/Ycf46/Vps4 family AAA+-type ATPase